MAEDRVVRAMARFPEVWVALFPAAYTFGAVLPALIDGPVSRAIFFAYRIACHQLPERTLHIAGAPMAVCARCFAIGAGLVLGAVVSGRIPRFKIPLWAIAVAAVPCALDGFTQLFGFRESTNTLRVLTGGLLGMTTSFWAVPHVYEAFKASEHG